jgi:hypothetical protein
MKQSSKELSNLGIKVESGVTEISLANARLLIKAWGKPALIVLSRKKKARSNAIDNHTTIYWGLAQKKFICNGFGWGYGGEGPNGLVKLLRELGLKKDVTDIARIKESQLPFVFEI